MEMKHTATPLSKDVTQTGEVFITDAFGAQLFKGEGDTSEGSTADDIVRAVNAHDDLVAALQSIKKLTAMGLPDDPDHAAADFAAISATASDALAKAGAK